MNLCTYEVKLIEDLSFSAGDKRSASAKLDPWARINLRYREGANPELYNQHMLCNGDD